MTPDEQIRLQKLEQKLQDLSDAYYTNNFSSSQDFQKYSRFNTRIKVPTLAATPSTCEIGELCVVSGTGKLYVCSAANTWVVSGTQS